MDVNSVLEATLSPDTTTRQNAEVQLSQAAESDFAGYLAVLSRELGNTQAQASTRQAAGLALKNALTSRDSARLRDIQMRWVQQIDPQVKKQVKETALQTLSSGGTAGTSASQLIASIAAIELPRNEWPDLMTILVQNVGQGTDLQKQGSLTTIGFICESEDPDLRDALVAHSNAILTAVVQGARKEETNNDVRNAALAALSDAIEFIRSNFENEGERNYIMQVICEATQCEDERVQAGAFGCLNRIMGIYYDKMRFYMEKALFGLTIMGMKSDEEDVAKLAIEFWCTVCEEEISIEDDNAQAQQEGSAELRQYFQFAKIAGREVLPVLLQLLTKVDENDAEDDYNTAKAAYQCLQLYAQCVGGDVVAPVLQFVEANLRNEDWHNRDAAVSSFGAIMDGPDMKTLDPLVKQALPVLISMMNDQSLQVQDSAAFALSRICDYCSDSIQPENLQPLMSALFNGLMSSPKMASSCCLALMNLTERFLGEDGASQNPLTPHFQDSVTTLLSVTEKEGADNQLRTAAYEVLGSFVTNAANDSLPIVASLSDVILERTGATLPMTKQVVSVDDKITLEELQTSLVSVLLAIVQRLEQNIAPQADRIMQVCLDVLNVTGHTSVPETVFALVGALTNSLETDFLKYMESFVPYLYNALGNTEAIGLCAMSVGLTGDIVRALQEKSEPYCDTFMNYLLNNLRTDARMNQLKPSILLVFGDMAQAIGTAFEKYLTVVAQVLQQAAGVSAATDVSYEMLDYVLSLREGVVDAWGSIVIAFRQTEKVVLLQNYVDQIFQMLQVVAQDMNKSEGLMRASMGVLGDLATAFPNGEISQYYRAEWINKLIKEARQNRDFSERTIQTAKWAREAVKRQVAAASHQVPRPFGDDIWIGLPVSSSAATLVDVNDLQRPEYHEALGRSRKRAAPNRHSRQEESSRPALPQHTPPASEDDLPPASASKRQATAANRFEGRDDTVSPHFLRPSLWNSRELRETADAQYMNTSMDSDGPAARRNDIFTSQIGRLLPSVSAATQLLERADAQYMNTNMQYDGPLAMDYSGQTNAHARRRWMNGFDMAHDAILSEFRGARATRELQGLQSPHLSTTLLDIDQRLPRLPTAMDYDEDEDGTPFGP